MTDPMQKVCARCGTEKTAADFWPDKRRKDGLGPYCRPCLRPSAKVCYRCQAEKPAGEFNRNARCKDGLDSLCRPCRSAYTTERWQNNIEALRADARGRYHARYKEGQSERVKERYRTDPAVREHEKARHAATYQRERARILARNRRWRALPGNRDRERESNRRYYETNKRTVQQWHRAYYESNKDAFNAISARRRAHKKAVQSIPFTSEQLADRWAYYGNRCWLCEKPATATDHVKPISKGGAHMLANLRPICKPCNSRKHNKWPYPPRFRPTAFC